MIPLVVDGIEVPKARSVASVITIPASGLTRVDAATFQVLGEVMRLGTVKFTRRAILSMGQSEVRTFSDFMQVQVTLQGSDFAAANELAWSLATEPSCFDEDVESAQRIVQSRMASAWPQALLPHAFDVSTVTPARVKSLHRALMQGPLKGFVWGSLDVDKARQDLNLRAKESVSPKGSRRLGGAGLGGWTVPVTGSMPAAMLAAAGLGGGKSSAMFQVVRQQLRVSYQQDFLLWPGMDGWRGRFLVLSGAAVPLPAVREGLLDAIKKWNDADLQRFRRLAAGALEGTLSPSFLVISPWRDKGADEADAAALASLLPGPLDLNAPTLEEVKSLAQGWVDQLK